MGLKGRLRSGFQDLADLAQYKFGKLKLRFLTSSLYKRYYVSKQSDYLVILLIICPAKIIFILGIGK